MYQHEFGVALAWAIKHERAGGNDIALIFDRAVLAAIQQAPPVNPVDTGFGVPIVRLLRRYGRRFTAASQFIYATYVPTEACLGMARLCGIDAIFCVSGGVMYRFDLYRQGVEREQWAPNDGGGIPNVRALGAAAATVKWYQTPAGADAELRAWRRALIDMPFNDDVRRAARQSRDLPVWDAPAPPPVFGGTGFEYMELRTTLNQTAVDNVAIMMTLELVAAVHGRLVGNPNRDPAFYGQNIACLLADANGAIVAWAVNTNRHNTTQHGESNLLINWVISNPGEGLPNGGTLYTTLEPCEMCAGMITRAVRTGHTFRVVYAQRDVNVGSTALKERVNNNITAIESVAAMTTWRDVRRGTARFAREPVPDALQRLHAGDAKAPQITRWVERDWTLKNVFSLGRPTWWLYLWDMLTPALARKRLDDPAVVATTQFLNLMLILGDTFMASVRRIAPPRR